MLRKRIITVLTINEGVLFRTKTFIPDYRYTMNFIDSWSIDEVVLLDVTRDRLKNKKLFLKTVEKIASNCFVPLAVGGGIRKLNDVSDYMSVGADKVVVNTGAIDDRALINNIASSYGKQCVVMSLDVRKNNLMPSQYEVFSSFGIEATQLDAVSWAKDVEKQGAGEIMVCSIERDGALQGYDINLCSKITSAVNIPVLISGGAGNWKHFEEGFVKGNADAVCTSNIYHFTETSIQRAKNYLSNKDILIRK